MTDVMGIELRKINIEVGDDHEKITGKIYIDNIKAGELINDGWCDEFYIEFINTKMLNKFNEIMYRLYEIKNVPPRIMAFKRVFEGCADVFVVANPTKSREEINVGILDCGFELVNLINMKDIYINQENNITIEPEDIIVITLKGSVVNGK
jgi:hypothetical protein